MFDLETDLKKLRKDKLFTEFADENEEQFLFDPDNHNMDENLYNLEENAMSTEELIQYGELSTNIRRSFEQKAKAIVDSLKHE